MDLFDFRGCGDDLRCLPQIDADYVRKLASMGVRSIICNRPDTEDGAVPSLEVARAARRSGIEFVYQPVDFALLELEHGRNFIKLLDALPKPAIAYCRTGRRSAALWVLGRAERLGADAAIAAARSAGCDLEVLRSRLTGTEDESGANGS